MMLAARRLTLAARPAGLAPVCVPARTYAADTPVTHPEGITHRISTYFMPQVRAPDAVQGGTSRPAVPAVGRAAQGRKRAAVACASSVV